MSNVLFSGVIQQAKNNTPTTYNYTGGTYFLTSDDDGKTLTTNNALNTTVFVLPDSVEGYSLTINSNTLDQPVSVIYGTGDTIDTTLSKNYAFTSGETINVACNTGGTWSFDAETVYNRFATDNDAKTLGVGSYIYSAPFTLSGKYSILSQNSGTPTYWYSNDYMETFEHCNFGDPHVAHTIAISSNGKYTAVWNSDDNTIQLSSDYMASFTTKQTVPDTTSLVPDWIGCLSYDGQRYIKFSGASDSYLYSDDYLETYSKKTISGGSSIRSVMCNASGQIMYAVDGTTKIWRSIDYGENWTVMKSNFPTIGIFTGNFGMSASGQYVFIPQNANNGNWWSDDFGVTWNSTTGGDQYMSYSSHSGKYFGWVGDGLSIAHKWSVDFGSNFTTATQSDIYNIRSSYIQISGDGTYALAKVMAEKEGGF